MTIKELEQHCKDFGIPFRKDGARFRVMDVTQLPGQMRPEFDERGFFHDATVKVAAPVEVLDAKRVPEDLSDLTVVELKDRARDLDISGFSSMTKDELVKAVKKANK